MFEDLIPSAQAQTPAPPSGVFDDLIPPGANAADAAKFAVPERADEPALPRSTAGTDPGEQTVERPARDGQLALALANQTNASGGTSAAAGIFDDLIPAAASIRGATAGGHQGTVAPEYEPVPDPWLGLKDAKTGIPLVRETTPGRFIAEVAGEDDGGLFWNDPETGERRRPSGNELIRPEDGKYKVYERQENLRPWTWTDMALIQAIKSGFSAPYDALAGNIAPNDVIQRAVDFGSLATPGTRFTPSRLRPRIEADATKPEYAPESPASSPSEEPHASAADANITTQPDPQPRPLSAGVPDFGSGVLRIAGKALESARQSLRDMFDAASRESPKQNQTVDLGMITPEGAARLNGLLRDAGIDTDVVGFRHTVDAYSARHSFTRHGAAATEEARGQLPVTSDDWSMIPNVLSSPDFIRIVPGTTRGREAIGYWKQVNGLVFYLEEVRTGRHTFAAVTMQKFKAGEPGVSGVPGGPDGLAPPRSTARTGPGNPNIDEPDGDSHPAMPLPFPFVPFPGPSAPSGMFDDLIPGAVTGAAEGGMTAN